MVQFFLKNLPDRSCIEAFAASFGVMDPDRAELYLNFMRASQRVSELISDYLSDHNLSPGRMTILMMLYNGESKTAAEIAERAGVTRPTVSGLVRGLMEGGWMISKRDPMDRRRENLSLTDEGRQRLDQILPGYFEQINYLMKPFSREESGQMVQYCERIFDQAKHTK